ncbi:hypothetical protein VP01_258g4 [Puccinia sorghi]|uniref:Uncharacterized protein n=1 Tax=Puccinia sorghi TaxID=27349 RepID=A0A0L6V5D7_9BASI|nr:hypothetical protein VP01_258g4 [Puccinia sorghi]
MSLSISIYSLAAPKQVKDRNGRIGRSIVQPEHPQIGRQELRSLVDENQSSPSPDATLTKLQEIVHLEESRKTKLLPTLTNKGNDDQTDSAAALMHESKDKKKKVYRRNTNYCTAGKHNPDSAHNADNCWQLHPELRPSSHAKPSIQLAEVSDGHESEVSLLLTTTVRPTVLDSGATHHMVNDATVFNATAKSNIKISTGGHNNFLNAEASERR